MIGNAVKAKTPAQEVAEVRGIDYYISQVISDDSWTFQNEITAQFDSWGNVEQANFTTPTKGYRGFWGAVGDFFGLDGHFGYQGGNERLSFRNLGAAVTNAWSHGATTVHNVRNSASDTAEVIVTAAKKSYRSWVYNDPVTQGFYAISRVANENGYHQAAQIAHAWGTYNSEYKIGAAREAVDMVKGTIQGVVFLGSNLNPLGQGVYLANRAGIDTPQWMPNAGRFYDPLAKLETRIAKYGNEVLHGRANPLADAGGAIGDYTAGWQKTSARGLEALAVRSGRFTGAAAVTLASLAVGGEAARVSRFRNLTKLETVAVERGAARLTPQQVKAKIFGTAQHTGSDGTHAFKSYREAILMARNPEVEAVFLNRGYNRGLDLAPNTINPNRRPDVLGRYFDGRVDRVEVWSKTDNRSILIQRNIDLDLQIQAQGFTPLQPRVVYSRPH